MSATRTRRLLLVFLVAAAIAQLPACGITQWQRDQDARAETFRELYSADFQRRVADAVSSAPLTNQGEAK